MGVLKIKTLRPKTSKIKTMKKKDLVGAEYILTGHNYKMEVLAITFLNRCCMIRRKPLDHRKKCTMITCTAFICKSGHSYDRGNSSAKIDHL